MSPPAWRDLGPAGTAYFRTGKQWVDDDNVQSRESLLMRYAVQLSIEYDYGSAVGAADHCLRLRPISRRNQIVGATTHLAVSPKPDDEAGRTDYFGNSVSFIHVDHPHDTLSIR
jgi:transglutaminase-like putative cysteine protease